MNISEIAKEFGLSIDTLRYYDQIGLLVPKRINNRRNYLKDDIMKLKKILKLKNLMFSLNEIKEIIEIDDQIDQDILKKDLNQNKINTLLYDIKSKYQVILDKERDILKVKSELEKLITKIEEYKKN